MAAAIAAAVVPGRTWEAARPLHINNVRIFDGQRIIAADSVVVANGKIVAVGSNLAAPPGAEIIDGSGDTLLPGLIDSHVHLWTRDLLERALVFGVTTELDMFMRWRQAKEWRREASEGGDIADFRTAGKCIATPGGHGSDYDVPDTAIAGPEQAQAAVDERIAHGSDYIKVMYDYTPAFPVMSRERLAAVVKAAHARGVPRRT